MCSYSFCEHYDYIIATMFFILTMLINSILIHKKRFSVFSLCASIIAMFSNDVQKKSQYKVIKQIHCEVK